MCVVSFVGDHYGEKFKPYFQDQQTTVTSWPQSPTQQEFDKLKKEVLEMKELLRKAKIYDEKNNEPNCEIEDKMNFLREVAKRVGVDLDDVLKPKE